MLRTLIVLDIVLRAIRTGCLQCSLAVLVVLVAGSISTENLHAQCQLPDIDPGEAKTKQITFRITVDEKTEERFRKRSPVADPGRYASIFGNKPIPKILSLNPDSKLLSHIFIWTDIAKPISKTKPEKHTIKIQDAQYTPNVIVATKRDSLTYVETGFKDIANSRFTMGVFDSIRDVPFELDVVDVPVQIESNLYPWMKAWVFVQDTKQCMVTNDKGECTMDLGSERKNREFRLWHPVLGSLDVQSPQKNVTVLKPGKISIAEPTESVIELVIKSP